MRSLQLIPLIVHLALSVPRLLPGAIVHQHGTTACVEDSIMVKLRISPTSLLEPISKLQNDLQEIQNNINRQVPNNTHQNYETSQILYHNVNSLQSKLNKIKYTIYHLPDPDNDTINTRRTKRGLFDFVGIISKSLFGTATDQDIHTVDTHIGKITRVLQQQGKLIDLNSQNIDLLADSVNSVIDKYNYLAQFTNTQLSQITNSQTALFFLYHLNNLDKELDSLKDHTNLIQKDIWNAHAGVVDSQMITPTQLTQTLRRAHSTLQLTPFFSKHEIQHYYPILASTIFQQFILINIPMDPVKRFSLWEIYPFPYPYQNRTMTLNLPTSTILKSTDGQWLTLTSPETITTCKTARPNFHICPAYPFHFQLTKSQPCLSELTTNRIHLTETCDFRFSDNTKIHHTHVGHKHFLYLPHPTLVSVMCPRKPPTHHKVNGSITLPDICQIYTMNSMLLPNNLHDQGTLNLTHDLGPITQLILPPLPKSPNTILPSKIDIIHQLNKSITLDMDSFDLHHRILPYTSTALSLLIILFILIIIIIFCCMK
ncbi:uncharacterized protein LOC143022694 [Oratosquilla oratoria]|uniref:uncharacterized protein LOC143022694 n=1 Tax=Oratosquilla oratoria TaxID=337810 RepID=UPI003F7600A7